jgi:hypothetical protein
VIIGLTTQPKVSRLILTHRGIYWFKTPQADVVCGIGRQFIDSLLDLSVEDRLGLNDAYAHAWMVGLLNRGMSEKWIGVGGSLPN